SYVLLRLREDKGFNASAPLQIARIFPTQFATHLYPPPHDLEADVIIAPSISDLPPVCCPSGDRHNRNRPALSPSAPAVRQMQIYWGVKPFQARRADSTDLLIESSVELLKEKNVVKSGDVAVVTAGVVSKNTCHEAGKQHQYHACGGVLSIFHIHRKNWTKKSDIGYNQFDCGLIRLLCFILYIGGNAIGASVDFREEIPWRRNHL
ncbi:MAG: pyruvate kinase alpha/beta domain-containing protein, partial [Clostridium sp.]